MKFKEFLEYHQKRWSGVSHVPGSSGHTALMRLWNGLGFLFPNKCEDTIIWERGQNPELTPNELNPNVTPTEKYDSEAVKQVQEKAKKKQKKNHENKGANFTTV